MDGGGLQRDGVAARDESRVPRGGEDLPEPEDGLPQAVPRARLAGVAPQQSREALAGVRTAGRQGEVGEQRLRLLHRHRDGPRFDAELEAAEERERDAGHGS